VIVLTCGADDEVVRLIPALTITDEEWDQGLAAVTTALAALRSQAA
jgi:4-aminobutyrate aminotransferase-like enzyme